MVFDQNLLFSDAQSIAQIAGNYLSDKSVDTNAAGTASIGGPLTHDYGRANDRLKIVGIVTEAVTSGGAATVQFQVVQATDAALTGSLKVLRQTAALVYSDLALGKVFTLGEVPSTSARYFGLRYVIGAATTTAGKITAGMSFRAPSNAMTYLTLAA